MISYRPRDGKPAVPHIPLLDHGFVELLNSMGDDLEIVQAAQASFDKESQGYGDREAKILQFLMSEEHGVPFEHVVLKFRMKLPLKFAAQFKKHRMSSWSEHSSRYSEMGTDTYMPKRFTEQVGRIGSYTFEPMSDDENEAAQALVAHSYRIALNAYRSMVDYGVAKEQASLVLPVGLYTEVVWTLNVRSLFNVLHLRIDSHAQWEAQQYAIAFEELAELVIPDTIRMFREAGRPKP